MLPLVHFVRQHVYKTVFVSCAIAQKLWDIFIISLAAPSVNAVRIGNSSVWMTGAKAPIKYERYVSVIGGAGLSLTYCKIFIFYVFSMHYAGKEICNFSFHIDLHWEDDSVPKRSSLFFWYAPEGKLYVKCSYTQMVPTSSVIYTSNLDSCNIRQQPDKIKRGQSWGPSIIRVFVEPELEGLIKGPWHRISLWVDWSRHQEARPLKDNIQARGTCSIITSPIIKWQKLVVTGTLVT